MSNKITVALVAGITAGLAIYLISKVIGEKKENKENERNRQAHRKTAYAYEYTL